MVLAFVMIKVGTGAQMNWIRKVKEEVEKLPEVEEAHAIFGRYDVLAKIRAKDWAELTRIVGDKIRSIAGVHTTETFVAYEEE
ncbi:MAG: Lrp/AsnC ligand binding domain-containing protein [Candidatus Hadarchaeales archaeon]